MRSKLTLCALGCLLFTLGSAQWLERQVLIGDTLGGVNYPEGIVVNPVSGNVYIETSPCDQVFNPATMQKVRGFDWGWVAFCPASGKGYLCRRDSAAVIDATADTLIGQIALPLRSPWAFAYSPLSNRLYLGSTSRETVYVFDP